MFDVRIEMRIVRSRVRESTSISFKQASTGWLLRFRRRKSREIGLTGSLTPGRRIERNLCGGLFKMVSKMSFTVVQKLEMRKIISI